MKEAQIIQAKISSSQLFNNDINGKSCLKTAYAACRYIYGIIHDSLISQFGWRRALESKSFSLPTILEGTRGY